MERLRGKRMLVTGASGYMGSDFARAFAREGADVLLSSRTPSKLQALAAELRESFMCRAHCIAADMTKPGDPERLADESWQAYDGIDGVLLSAQPENPFPGDLLTTPDATWSALHEMLVWGPLRLMRALAPRMIQRGGGSIISIISSTGLHPTPGTDAYGMAKGSLWLLTRYMAREWGHGGVRANAINPGTIAGVAGEQHMRELAEKTGTLSRIALGRIGSNADVVGAAVYLASDESAYCSGQLITIDGGRF